MKTNNLTQKILQELRRKFEHDPKCLAIEDDDEDCVCAFGQMQQFFLDTISQVRKETLEEANKKIDAIEHSYVNTSLEEWKAFKHIRNALRVLASLKGEK